MKQTRISKSARGKACTMRSPVCNHDPNTTILAHAPFSGRFGSRGSWWWSAYLCSDCHDLADNRSNHPMTQDELRILWYEAVRETQAQLFESNLLKVV